MAINYHAQDFAATVAEATGGEGVDMVLDMVRVCTPVHPIPASHSRAVQVAGEYTQKNLDLLKPGGRLVGARLSVAPVAPHAGSDAGEAGWCWLVLVGAG